MCTPEIKRTIKSILKNPQKKIKPFAPQFKNDPTRDLENYIKALPYHKKIPLALDYRLEIVTRLRAYQQVVEIVEKSGKR